MASVERITRTVTLVEILASGPPAIMMREQLVGMGNRSKPFSQKVAVPDRHLFERLLRETRSGDEIEVTTATDWSSALLLTYLVDFAVVSATPERREA